MLNIARRAILDRAALDGYAAEDYDPAEDPEGYIISLLIGLHHWCRANSIEWQAELARAQQLFEEDLCEEREGESIPPKEVSKCGESTAREVADQIFNIVCDSNWPEQPDAWPKDAILDVLERLQQRNAQTPAGTSATNEP
jgi:hypothetical protein